MSPLKWALIFAVSVGVAAAVPVPSETTRAKRGFPVYSPGGYYDGYGFDPFIPPTLGGINEYRDYERYPGYGYGYNAYGLGYGNDPYTHVHRFDNFGNSYGYGTGGYGLYGH